MTFSNLQIVSYFHFINPMNHFLKLVKQAFLGDNYLVEVLIQLADFFNQKAF